MRPTLGFAAFAVAASSVASGQPAGAAPAAFDAASVRIRVAGGTEAPRNGPWIQTSPGGVTMRNAKLLWSLAWAYDKKDWLISGPDWIGSERYDIVAKTAGPVPIAQLRLMLQALLADRFKLALHDETKELPVAVLVLGKNGAKNLQAAAASGGPDGPRPMGGRQFHSLVYKNVSMSDFGDRLGAAPLLGAGDSAVDGTVL